MTLQQIVDQLKACHYTCEAGKLELNTHFVELERLAREASKSDNITITIHSPETYRLIIVPLEPHTPL